MASTNSDIASIFFFNDTATTEIYTLSLHDALPIYEQDGRLGSNGRARAPFAGGRRRASAPSHTRLGGVRPHRARAHRSEEHTSELQSQSNLVCRLLLEKKKNTPSATLMRRICIATA